jgi:hypothetical protein
MLIGLCGAAGSGKDSVASFLTGYRKVAFADPLYECVSAITSIPVEQLKDRVVKEAVIPWIGKSPRQMLQTLGTEWGRDTIHSEIWVRATHNRISGDLGGGANIAITDVRFTNEAGLVLECGGEVWRVVRPGLVCLAGETATHSSEAGIPDSMVSRVILNDGTLDDLKRKVEEAIIRG